MTYLNEIFSYENLRSTKYSDMELDEESIKKQVAHESAHIFDSVIKLIVGYVKSGQFDRIEIFMGLMESGLNGTINAISERFERNDIATK